MAGMALTGWAFCLLVRRWTGSWAAGYVAGSLAGVQLARPDAPPASADAARGIHRVGAVLPGPPDRVAAAARDAVWLGVSFALQGLTSVYLLVFTTWMLLFAVLGRAGEWLRREPVRMARPCSSPPPQRPRCCMAPYLWAYSRLHRLTGFERTVAKTPGCTPGSWVSYLITGSRLHFGLWSHRFFGQSESTNFPGLTALVLVALALAWPETRRDVRVRMCLVAAAGCAMVSMLPNTPIYPLLHRSILLFRAVRVQAHLGQIVLLMLAVVAGFGVAGLARRWRAPPAHGRSWPSCLRARQPRSDAGAVRVHPVLRIPPIYDVLARERGAVVVELPFWPPRIFFATAHTC